MTDPIRPSEVAAAKAATLPKEVIDIFNQLITEYWDGNRAKILQKHVVAAIIEKMSCNRQDVFDRGWLNVESVYRLYGWKVYYVKSDYDDPLDPYWEFTEKKIDR